MIYDLLKFPVHGNHQGSLVALEKGSDFPFEIKRVYYIWGTDKDVVRGKHAHRKLEQVIVCVSGSCDFILDNGKERTIVHLDNPSRGLYIKHNIWREFTNFSQDCVVMVLASEHYDESDYIRNYDEFICTQVEFVEYDKSFLEKSWMWLMSEPLKTLTNTPDFTKQQQLEWFDGIATNQNYFVQGISLAHKPIGVWGLKKITQHDAEYFGYIGEVDCWGKGIGKRMVAEAIAEAKKRKLDVLYLTVLKSNIRAILLYNKFNFKENLSKNKNNLMYMELNLKDN